MSLEPLLVFQGLEVVVVVVVIVVVILRQGLPTEPTLASDLYSSCLSLPSAEITGVHHPTLLLTHLIRESEKPSIGLLE
jgi:hypothetical protein